MTGDVESRLRQLASGAPSPEAWGALCTEIDRLSDAELVSVVGWMDAALAHWPSDLRVMPDGWWRKLCAGDGRAARLARLREIPGIEPAFDGDWDFQGRTMWAQLGPKRDVVLTAEGLEAHRAGGDVSLMDAAGAQPWLPLIDGTDDYGEVADATFDPGGKRAVVAWADQALRVRAFDTDTGDQLWAWRHRSKQELADTPWVLIEVSPNGKWVALLSAITRGVVVLDAASGKKQAKLSAPGLNTFRFDAEGDSILTATSKGGLARWRLPDGERLWSTHAHEDAIDALAVSPAGEVATLAGQSLKLWTTSETGPTLGREIALPENSSGDLVYHPRRGLLIFGVSPEALQIVEVASGEREIVGLQSVRHAWSRDGADLVLVALNTAVSKAAVWQWCPDGDWTRPSPPSTRVNPLERR